MRSGWEGECETSLESNDEMEGVGEISLSDLPAFRKATRMVTGSDAMFATFGAAMIEMFLNSEEKRTTVSLH